MSTKERNPQTASGELLLGNESRDYAGASGEQQGQRRSTTARLWEPTALEGFVEGEIFGVLAPEKPEVTAEQVHAIRGFFKSVRSGIPPAAV